MTSPGGSSGNVNLASLWVPVIPETSKLGEQMRKAGQEAKREFESGFGSGGGGLNPQQLGSNFGQQFSAAFNKNISGVGLGVGSIFDKIGSQMDERLANTLRNQLPNLLNDVRTAQEKLTTARQHDEQATMRLTTAQNAQNVPFAQMTGLMRDSERAHQQLSAATEKSESAQTKYTSTLNSYNTASAHAFNASSMLAGAMGGALVLGIGAVVSGFENLIELGAHLFEDAIHGAETMVEKLVEIGEEYQHLSIQLTEFSAVSGEAMQKMAQHAAAVFGTLDVAGKDFGKTYAQLGSMIGLTAGPALDELAKKVTELQGRFGNLRSSDIGSIFVAFKTPADQVNSTLDSLLQSARAAGTGFGDMAADVAASGATLQEAGLDAEQAGHLIGELEKHGIAVQPAMTGMATAMKQFGKEGLSFKDGMKEAGKELKELGDTAAGNELAMELFGRKWTQVVPIVDAFNDTVNATPGAFAAATGSTQEFIDKTEDLGNKIEEIKHHLGEMFKPFGDAARDAVEHGLDHISKWFDDNRGSIVQDVKNFGDSFINTIPGIVQFGEIAIQVFGQVGNFLKSVTTTMMEEGAFLLKTWGYITGDKEARKSADEMLTSAKQMEKLDLGRLATTTNQWLDGIIAKVPEAKRGWDNLSNSMMATPPPGGGGSSPGAPAAGGQSFGAGGLAGAPAPAGNAGAAPAGNAGGQDTAQSMKSAIITKGKQLGLTDTEIGMVLSVGKLESNFSGPGYMGFGPEAKAAGYNFDKNPTGAVDQFYKQFMDRRGAEGDPNNPQAVADYIWHTVQHASDPEYSSKLLQNFGKGFSTGAEVTTGSGHWDDVPAMLTKGEFVINKESSEKYRTLLRYMNGNPRGFSEGGIAGAEQWASSVSGQPYSYGNLDCSGVVASSWGIIVGKGPGHWFDTTQFASDSNAAKFGFAPGTQPGAFNIAVNPEPGEQGHMVAMFPDGTILESGGVSGGVKLGSKANFGGFEKHFYLAGGPQAPGGGGGGGSGGGGGGSFGGGGGGGQFGGYSLSPGETPEQWQRQKSLASAQDRVSDLNKEITDKQAELDKTQKDLDDLKNKPKLEQDQDKIDQKQKQLDSLNSDIDKIKNKELPEAQGDLTMEQNKPAGKKSGGKSGEYGAEQQLGSGLLSGIGQELGFGDLFGKPPWEWGAFKLLAGFANWGIGTMNAIGDARYGPGGGMGGLGAGAAGSVGLGAAAQYTPPGMPAPGSDAVPTPPVAHLGTGWPPGPGATPAPPGPKPPAPKAPTPSSGGAIGSGGLAGGGTPDWKPPVPQLPKTGPFAPPGPQKTLKPNELAPPDMPADPHQTLLPPLTPGAPGADSPEKVTQAAAYRRLAPPLPSQARNFEKRYAPSPPSSAGMGFDSMISNVVGTALTTLGNVAVKGGLGQFGGQGGGGGGGGTTHPQGSSGNAAQGSGGTVIYNNSETHIHGDVNHQPINYTASAGAGASELQAAQNSSWRKSQAYAATPGALPAT